MMYEVNYNYFLAIELHHRFVCFVFHHEIVLNRENLNLKAFSDEELALEWIRRVCLVVESEAGGCSEIYTGNSKQNRKYVFRRV